MKKLLPLIFFLFLTGFTFGQTQVSSFTAKTFSPNTALFTSNNEGELFFFAVNHQEKILLYNSYKEGSNIDSTAFNALRIGLQIEEFSSITILEEKENWGLWKLDEQLVFRNGIELSLIVSVEDRNTFQETDSYYFFRKTGGDQKIITRLSKMTAEFSDLPALSIPDFDKLEITKVGKVLVWESFLWNLPINSDHTPDIKSNATWTTDLEGNYLRSLDFYDIPQLPCSPRLIHNDSLLVYEDSTFNISLYPVVNEGEPRVLGTFIGQPYESYMGERYCNVVIHKVDELLIISYHPQFTYHHYFLTDYKGSTYTSRPEEYENRNLYLANGDLSDGVYTENDSVIYFDVLNKIYCLNKNDESVFPVSGVTRQRFYLGEKDGLDYYWLINKLSSAIMSFDSKSSTWVTIDSFQPTFLYLVVPGEGAYYQFCCGRDAFGFYDLKKNTFTTITENGNDIPPGRLSLEHSFENGSQMLNRFNYTDSTSFKTVFNTNTRLVTFNKNVGKSGPFYFDEENSQLYYLDSISGAGVEPFLYDINSDSTFSLGDLNKRLSSSGLTEFFTFNDIQYGIAKDSNEVYQVWQFDAVSIEEETEESPVVEEEEPREPEIEEPEDVGVTVEEEVVLSVEESNSLLLVFPNPSKNILNFDFPIEVKVSKIEIFNAKGLLIEVLGKPINNYIDVSGLQPGAYLLKVNESLRLTKKFIKN